MYVHTHTHTNAYTYTHAYTHIHMHTHAPVFVIYRYYPIGANNDNRRRDQCPVDMLSIRFTHTLEL